MGNLTTEEQQKVLRMLDDLSAGDRQKVLSSQQSFGDWLSKVAYSIYCKVGDWISGLWEWLF